MARTAADAVASARRTMNDAAGVRASTPELEGYLLDGLNHIRNERPDLFVGRWGEIAAVTGSNPIPLDAQFFRPLVDYMVARAESKDAEHVLAGRAKLMSDLAGGFLK
jgi:hypothetical protein